MTSKQIRVIDTGAIIAGVHLSASNAEYVTVPDVIEEARDKKARERLESLPFELKTERPSSTALYAVSQWIKATGDVAFLSATDIYVLALAYTMQERLVGKETMVADAERRLRNLKPVHASTISLHKQDKESSENPPCVSTLRSVCIPASCTKTVSSSGRSYAAMAAHNEKSNILGASLSSTSLPCSSISHASSGGASLSAQTASTHTSGTSHNDIHLSESPVDVTPLSEVHKPVNAENGGWIGPDNLNTMLASGADTFTGKHSTAAEQSPKVVCVTGDFTMQNVLLGMGIPIMSPIGKLIRKVKQFVLKCDACFRITRELERKFCPGCGNSTLARLGVTVDKNGRQHYHYKANRQVNIRGSKFPLPAPKGGRQSDLLLREDQLLTGSWAQRARAKTRVSGMFAEVDDSSASKVITGADVIVGMGRKNPNAKKGRERRGKKNRH